MSHTYIFIRDSSMSYFLCMHDHSPIYCSTVYIINIYRERLLGQYILYLDVKVSRCIRIYTNMIYNMYILITTDSNFL